MLTVVTAYSGIGSTVYSSIWDHSMDSQMTDQFNEICVVERDLTEFNVVRFGSFVRRIDLSFNLLTQIHGLEGSCDTLEELILDNNQLSRLDLQCKFPRLHTLSLNKNRITNLGKLIKDLTVKTPSLRYLSLLGNPACPDQLTDENVEESDYLIYRYHILNQLQQLRFLDHRSVTESELSESMKVTYARVKVSPGFTPLSGPGLVSITRNNSLSRASEGMDCAATSEGIPTVSSFTSNVPRRSRQGKRRFKYTGKNSEGNRFIKDSDL